MLALLISMDRREALLKCLDGLMLMSKLSANPSEKWDGWESKFSLLKKVFLPLNGPKMVNSTLGGSITSHPATDFMEDMDLEMNSEI